MGTRKSNAIYDIAELLHDGAITMDDLSDFSEELRDNIVILTSRDRSLEF